MFSQVFVCSKEGISGSMSFLAGWVSLVPGPLQEGICPGGIFQGGEYGEWEKGIFFFDLCRC